MLCDACVWPRATRVVCDVKDPVKSYCELSSLLHARRTSCTTRSSLLLVLLPQLSHPMSECSVLFLNSDWSRHPPRPCYPMSHLHSTLLRLGLGQLQGRPRPTPSSRASSVGVAPRPSRVGRRGPGRAVAVGPRVRAVATHRGRAGSCGRKPSKHDVNS